MSEERSNAQDSAYPGGEGVSRDILPPAPALPLVL